ncbi:MAG: YfcC family protein [Mycoplasmatota bacterium]|nr:YfcC family protein [Mycoplasmatota bacterium]
MAKKTKKKTMLSAFSIILIMIFGLGILSHILPQAEFVGEELVNGSGVVGAKLSDILMSPILGFQDAMDVCVFIMILGAFLAVVTKTGALETGIKVLIRKLKGKELLLIPILMFIFSIGGTTYGMLEETVGFYALLSATMVAAGMDTIVASATILLGAGVGVLGSTINPFAVGAAIDALPEGIAVNQGITIAIGVALWLTSYIIAVIFVMRYAKKVKADKGSTFLSLQEQKAMDKRYGDEEIEADAKLTTKQKITLWIFGLTFVIMICGFIPWEDLGVTFFTGITGKLTGSPLGAWWFNEGGLWFLIVTILLCIINGFSEKETVDTFIDGADDMVGVILIIGVARGASVLMTTTHLDNYIIFNAANWLRSMPAILYAPCNYLLHIVLSVLVPSSSGIASLSTPIMGPLTHELGFSVETNIMILVAANGLVNLVTPTCGAIMGGLALARVEYSTWFKWVWRLILYLAFASMIILTLAMIIF